MAKRSAEDILSDIIPKKSAKRYDENWNDFLNYVQLDFTNPLTEENFLQYFDYLRNIKGYVASTLWSRYSMINSKYQMIYGKKLQSFPRLTVLLKSYEQGYSRKVASVFSKSEIMQFLNSASNIGKFLYQKVICVIAFSGGLRCADLIGIQFCDIEFNETTGYWIQYSVSKQHGECIKNKFNVIQQGSEIISQYTAELQRCGVLEGRLFKSFRLKKDGSSYYTNQPMGIHVIQKIGIDIATYLGLGNPLGYTGHCFRRSSACVLAEAGATGLIMKDHFNWKNEQTATKYIVQSSNKKKEIASMLTNPQGSKFASTATGELKTDKTVTLQNCSNVIINL